MPQSTQQHKLSGWDTPQDLTVPAGTSGSNSRDALGHTWHVHGIDVSSCQAMQPHALHTQLQQQLFMKTFFSDLKPGLASYIEGKVAESCVLCSRSSLRMGGSLLKLVCHGLSLKTPEASIADSHGHYLQPRHIEIVAFAQLPRKVGDTDFLFAGCRVILRESEQCSCASTPQTCRVEVLKPGSLRR